ncbi:MAG TPA: ribonuclease III [Dehalococcoidia bacterium]|nr:ribonuclease III [Dehalococcoidia bacterium]
MLLLYFIVEMVNWNHCQKNLGISFRQESLLEQAFVHSSYSNENPDFEYPSNERLEFLGDAVLNFIVTEELYEEFPKLPEGELTEIRASLVCRDTLADLASSLKLGDWLLLGRGEETNAGRTKTSNLANAMEALIGALYLDQGIAKARRFILRQLKPELKKIKAGKTTPNYKALVQELIQGQKKPTPVYRLVKAIGPDHNKQFTTEILVDGEALGRGTGSSKKVSENQAARAAWEKLRCSHG